VSFSQTDQWRDLGEAAALPEGEPRSFAVGSRKICVIAQGGQVYALADLCTHGQAFLSEGYCDLAEGVVECPLHGGLFDFRNGAPKGAPAEKGVEVFPAKTVGGRLLVQVPEA
jgi:nitrite reductase/ring-hydroxylating ferredoxin subunit